LLNGQLITNNVQTAAEAAVTVAAAPAPAAFLRKEALSLKRDLPIDLASLPTRCQ